MVEKCACGRTKVQSLNDTHFSCEAGYAYKISGIKCKICGTFVPDIVLGLPDSGNSSLFYKVECNDLIKYFIGDIELKEIN